MRMLVSVAAVTLVLGADAPADAVKTETAQLEGEWTMVSGKRDGQKLPDDFVKSGKRVAKDGVSTVTFGDPLFMKARLTIDPGKKPKTIDYEVIDGQGKGKTVLGIYEIDGNTVKFCFAAPDKERPTEFASKEGSGHTLSVWKRTAK
ncbi:MAG TPA: TIGR03067 domain-containing protein [Gemmataceae bacterium]|nr:TIGR03067 domain-containing protein [Gemmataceae bacterium]